MKPIDPRLIRCSAPARTWIALSAALTASGTLTTILMGVLVGDMTARLATHGAAVPAWQWGALATAASVRALIAWCAASLGHRAAARVIEDLRSRLLSRVASADPRSVDRSYTHAILTTGLAGFEPYLTGFLPALAATVIATPAALAMVFYLDLTSGLIALITLPLIPLFMWLVGTLTQGRTARRLRDLGILNEQMMDLIAGLPTLRAYRRTASPAREIERLGRAHHVSTMRVLRIAFLSGFVLEFLATLSVAVVAVSIGVRLLGGSLTLASGLMVLIIIPEVYNPLREVGTHFHAAQDGIGAMEDVLDKLDRPNPTPRWRDADGELRPTAIAVAFDNLSSAGRDGIRPRNLTGVALPGELTVLRGPNGSGKSTALLALTGIATQGISGRARAVDAVTGRELAGPSLWRHLSFLPQRPVLSPTHMGDSSGLSLGQRQRVAVATELEKNKPLVLLDEPTAHLDSQNALLMIHKLRATAAAGATVLVASHDPLLVSAADRVIEVRA